MKWPFVRRRELERLYSKLDSLKKEISEYQVSSKKQKDKIDKLEKLKVALEQRIKELSDTVKKDPSFLTPFRLDNVMIPTISASYVIFKKGDYSFAQPCRHGLERFYGRDSSSVIQSAINALTSGRTWKEKVVTKGNFTINDTVKLSSYTILEIQGKWALADGVNANLIENSDRVTGNVEIEILGGKLDGNRASQTALSSLISLRRVKDLFISDMLLTKGYEYGIDLTLTERFYIGNIIGDDAGGDDFISIRENSKYGTVKNAINLNHSNFLSTRATSDFEVEDSVQDIVFENCWGIGGTNKQGFMIGDPTFPPVKHITLINPIAIDKAERGIFVNGSSTNIMEDIKIVNPIIRNAGTYQGIRLSYTTYMISNPYITGSATDGLGIGVGAIGEIKGGLIEKNVGHGVSLYDATHNRIVDVTIRNNSQPPSGAGAKSGIYISGASTDNLVKTCRIFDDQPTKTQGRAIIEAGTSDYNSFMNNDVRGNLYTPISFIGANTKVKFNIGYVTENCGVASGASPITIPQTTHLLDTDPTYVNAVSKTSGQYVISVSYDPVTKDITIEHSGGATSIDVFWEAKV